MKKMITIALMCVVTLSLTAQEMPWGESRGNYEQRMQWWEDSRFGMFIHWGLYAIPAGEWEGRKFISNVEWIQNYAGVEPTEYEKLAEQWNPIQYDPNKWVTAAKNAGMKYIVITTRHHEGFSLWPTEQSDFSVKNTPYAKDLIGPLVDACRKNDIKVGFYYSIMDWHHKDYLPRQRWDHRSKKEADYTKYINFMKAQLTELVTNYDPEMIWFDGEWEKTWTHEAGMDLYNFLREIKPELIVNNRVDKGRTGMNGMNSSENFYGDFGTPEQEIPSGGLPGVYWESCMTMNNTWGYSSKDNNWKSAEKLILNLADCASKGGNYLLNVGPMADGNIPAASLERLEAVGAWMKSNGDAIYGTKASHHNVKNAKVTVKGDKIYLILYKNNFNKVKLPKMNINKAYFLANSEKKELEIKRMGSKSVIKLPKDLDYSQMPVIVIE